MVNLYNGTMSELINVLLLLTPKNQLKFLDASNTARQGVEKIRITGYTAIPVVDSKSGCYVGTISEGDLLWQLLDAPHQSLKDLESIKLIDLIDSRKYKAMHVETPMDDLVKLIMNQNFVPIIDDRGVFMGIVTRRKVIEYYYGLTKGKI